MNPEPVDLSLAPVESLPEDSPSTTTNAMISSDVDYFTIINRWQPMGYRVVINLPFVSDDINPLFAIKVTPYIPPVIQWRDPNNWQISTATNMVLNGSLFSPIYPSPSTLSTTSMAVTCTRYDTPPSLSVAASAHRFWRGSMKYRLRCVSNFVAQGYVIVTVAKGLVADEVITLAGGPGGTQTTNTLATAHRAIQGLDTSAKRWMGNSYLMSDVSMFRHNEISVPFEYPVKFYDTYRSVEETISRSSELNHDVNCPDNFIVVYNRGGITSPTPGAQVVYELEYAPGEDFELSSEYCFSRQLLEINNFNITSDEPTLPVLGLPFTYPNYP